MLRPSLKIPPQHNLPKQPPHSSNSNRQNLDVALQASKMFHRVLQSRDNLSLHQAPITTDNLLPQTLWPGLTRTSLTKDKAVRTTCREKSENARVGELLRTQLPQLAMILVRETTREVPRESGVPRKILHLWQRKNDPTQVQEEM